MKLAAPYLVSAVATALTCVAISRGGEHRPLVSQSPVDSVPNVDAGAQAYAQAVNVVHIHPRRESVDQALSKVRQRQQEIANAH